MVSIVKKAVSHRLVSTALRILLGVVFIWAGVPKIVNPQGFAEIVANYQLLPPVTVNLVAIGLPWVEALCGLLLISGRMVHGSALSVVALMALFTIVTAVNMIRGLDVDCGCFSVAAGERHGSQVVNMVRNLALIAVGVFVSARAEADRRGGC